MSACKHARGEYSDHYRHCLDCGREGVLIGGAWFEVEAWVRVSESIIREAEAHDGSR